MEILLTWFVANCNELLMLEESRCWEQERQSNLLLRTCYAVKVWVGTAQHP